jgi:acetyl-CoA synthetase
LLKRILLGINNGIKSLILIHGGRYKNGSPKQKYSQNCIDRHLNKRGEDCHYFRTNDPTEKALHITYNELHQRVCKMANVLRARNKKGDRVCIYLPMIPELVVNVSLC